MTNSTALLDNGVDEKDLTSVQAHFVSVRILGVVKAASMEKVFEEGRRLFAVLSGREGF